MATVFSGSGGLAAVRIDSPKCTGELYLLGAQVTRWKPEETDEVLWLSEKSNYFVGKAIRGGVPICFPWFGAKADDPKAPAHGFVRTREWDLESISQENDNVTVTLRTRSDESTKHFWPADFELHLRAAFGRQLELTLKLTNTGLQSARAEEALHAYFHVGDVRQCEVHGLDGTAFLDKTDGNNRKLQSGDVTISSETDRVYLDTAHDVTITDPVLRRRILIHKQNSRNSVVWNPWIDKARALADFGDDEWPHMICIEPSNVAANAVEVLPAQQHQMAMMISVSAL